MKIKLKRKQISFIVNFRRHFIKYSNLIFLKNCYFDRIRNNQNEMKLRN